MIRPILLRKHANVPDLESSMPNPIDLKRLAVSLAIVMALFWTAACGGDKAAPGIAVSPTATTGATPLRTETPAASPTIAPVPAASTAAPTPAVATRAGSVRQLRLVPFDDFSPALLTRLQRYFQDTYGLQVTVAPSIAVPVTALDNARQQVIAERLLDAVASASPAAGSRDVSIALTEYDMMIADKPEWRFGFSLRNEAGAIAVISTARMDPANYGLPRDDELLFRRVLKMVSKSVGILYYGLPVSADPTSVMYNNILSVDDLDQMGERLPVP